MEVLMLKEILDPCCCAQCRICCVFDSTDIWEIPVFSGETAEKIMAENPDIRFIPKGGGYVTETGNLVDGELFRCPALGENGCILGDSKPFDCRIWPFRIMKIGDRRGITVASLCHAVYSQPLSGLVNFLRKGLADEIFRYADEHPEIIKEYDEGYPVLLLERR